MGPQKLNKGINIMTAMNAKAQIKKSNESEYGITTYRPDNLNAPGLIQIPISEDGQYTVHVWQQDDTNTITCEETQTINITSSGPVQKLIIPLYQEYGVQSYSRLFPSLKWIGDAEIFNDQIKYPSPIEISYGADPGHSVFDYLYPWCAMERVTLNGNVMVKIPIFYIQKCVMDKDNITVIISSKPGKNGFLLGCFEDETKELYIAAYPSAYNADETTFVSKSGLKIPIMPTTAQYLQDWLNAIDSLSSKLNGYSNIDLWTLNAVQLLMLIEFNTFQIGEIFHNGSICREVDAQEEFITGITDNVVNLTGLSSGKGESLEDGMIYRGIENFIFGGRILYISRICIFKGGLYFMNGVKNDNTYSNIIPPGRYIGTTNDTEFINSFVIPFYSCGLDSTLKCIWPQDSGIYHKITDYREYDTRVSGSIPIGYCFFMSYKKKDNYQEAFASLSCFYGFPSRGITSSIYGGNQDFNDRGQYHIYNDMNFMSYMFFSPYNNSYDICGRLICKK